MQIFSTGSALRPVGPMQKLQLGGQPQTALACQCRSFPSRAVGVTATGKADADFVTAEDKGASRRDVGLWR
jgi:hypothetical protein